MERNGWNVHTNSETYSSEKCDSSVNMGINNTWYGFFSEAAVGSVSTILIGSGRARLVYGNCFSQNKVSVHLNAAEISSAQGDEIQSICFNYKDGDILKIQEDEAVIKLHSFTLDCSGMYDNYLSLKSVIFLQG